MQCYWYYVNGISTIAHLCVISLYVLHIDHSKCSYSIIYVIHVVCIFICVFVFCFFFLLCIPCIFCILFLCCILTFLFSVFWCWHYSVSKGWGSFTVLAGDIYGARQVIWFWVFLYTIMLLYMFLLC